MIYLLARSPSTHIIHIASFQLHAGIEKIVTGSNLHGNNTCPPMPNETSAGCHAQGLAQQYSRTSLVASYQCIGRTHAISLVASPHISEFQTKFQTKYTHTIVFSSCTQQSFPSTQVEDAPAKNNKWIDKKTSTRATVFSFHTGTLFLHMHRF